MTESSTHRYAVIETKRFLRDIVRIKKMGRYDLRKLQEVILLLIEREPLPSKLRDHALGGKLQGKRECHIESDWLLVYRKNQTMLILELLRTGRHVDLFEE